MRREPNAPRDTAAERREAMARARAWVALDRLWASIPDAGCKGLCQSVCGPIGMSEVERDRIERIHGIRIGLAEVKPGTTDCPALVSGDCSIYAHRPTVCRLWGSSEDMPCPHGCVPESGRLNSARSLLTLNASLMIDGTTHPLSQEHIEAAFTDPEVSELLQARMRGDRSRDRELRDRLVEVWAT